MAKQTTAQPNLSTLIERIQALSVKKVTKGSIAKALGIRSQHLWRLLSKEKDGEVVPPHIIARLINTYSAILAPVEVKIEEKKVWGLLEERLIRMEEYVKMLTSYLAASLPDAEWKEAEAAIEKALALRVGESRLKQTS